MELSKCIVAVLIVGSVVAGFSGCKKEGPAERAGKEIDRSAEKVGREIEKVGEKMDDVIRQIKR